ncbi:MAG: universal stress protein [Candidatus Tectomicrobia bacterium]|nr:universal stress protein [Candidatus Tectomicrobia bacterium]
MADDKQGMELEGSPLEASPIHLQTILVPTDYSEHSTVALQWGASLAQHYGAQLLLLHVVPKAVEELPPPGAGAGSLIGPSSMERLVTPGDASPAEGLLIDHVAQAETALAALARTQLPAPVPATARVAVGRPAEEILRVAEEAGVDLIVMGTHGRTGLRHVLMGTVAEAVERTAGCAVLTIKAPAPVAS